MEKLANAILYGAKIKEESWNGNRYLISMRTAADVAAERAGYDMRGTKLINILLTHAWNEVLPWAEAIVAEQKKAEREKEVPEAILEPVAPPVEGSTVVASSPVEESDPDYTPLGRKSPNPNKTIHPIKYIGCTNDELYKDTRFYQHHGNGRPSFTPVFGLRRTWKSIGYSAMRNHVSKMELARVFPEYVWKHGPGAKIWEDKSVVFWKVKFLNKDRIDLYFIASTPTVEHYWKVIETGDK